MVGPRMVNFSLLPDAFSTWEKMTGALAYEIEIRLADSFSPRRNEFRHFDRKCFSKTFENIEKFRNFLLNDSRRCYYLTGEKKMLECFSFLFSSCCTSSERTYEISLIDRVIPPIFFQGSTRSRNLDPSLEFIGNEFIGRGMQERGWLLYRFAGIEFTSAREINFEGGIGFFRRKDFSLKIDIAVGSLFRG